MKRIKKENEGYYSSYVKSLCDSYGYGFCYGISEAFSKQQEENKSEWGLVLVMPKEVKEAAQHLGHQEFKARTQDEISPSDYARGYMEGKEFDPTRRLAGEAAL